MTEYTIKKIGDAWYVSTNKDPKTIASTYDYQLAKYIYYSHIMHRSIQTASRILKKVMNLRLRDSEQAIIEATVLELNTIINLIENEKEDNFEL